MLSNFAFANNRVPKFETTRMKSTAGAGVASILMDEATLLNPATIAYYNQGGIFFQRSGIDSTRTQGSVPETQEFSSMSIIASDSKGPTGGSLSYNTVDYRGQKVQKISSAFARPIGEKSSFGANFSYLKEEIFNQNNVLEKNDYKVMNFGVAHALSESFTMGFVVNDPFKEKVDETRAIAGIQYVFKGFFSLMFDAGADYNQDLSQTVFWKAASQLKIFSDFFIRFGTYRDKGLQEKGTGAGVGWLQPRLVMELAVKNTQVLESLALNQTSEDIKETSFSLSYRF